MFLSSEDFFFNVSSMKICRIENYGLEMALQITAFIMPNLTDSFSAVLTQKIVPFNRFQANKAKRMFKFNYQLGSLTSFVVPKVLQ